MEKIKVFAKNNPAVVSVAICLAGIWAYHNGYLNSLMSSPTKVKLVEEQASSVNEKVGG